MRDAASGAAARDSVGFGAAFDQGRQVASGMDLDLIINSVHVPEDAGEHEEALLRLLLRIPDGWGRWISCSSGWFARLARAERDLADACPTFAVHQIKEKYGTLRLYVDFDHDDDLPTELRAAEPRCPSLEVLAEHLGTTGASRDSPVGDAWQNGYETIFVPAHEEWSARVAVFRESDAGMRAAEDQARRSAAFKRLVEKFEQESTTTCDSCGGHGVLSCTAARMPWYAVRCDECRDAGWILASEWQEWRRRTQPGEHSFGVTTTVGKTKPAYRYAAGTSRTWLKASATEADTLGINATNSNFESSATYWTFAPGGRTLIL